MEIPEIDEVPEPNSGRFGIAAYNFAKWMKQAATAFNGLRTELLDALNQSLLGTTSTSTSSITIAAPGGTVNFTTGINKGYAIGMTLRLASTANPANYIKVRLTAYNITTGVSAGTIIGSGGSGTYTSWSVFFDTPDPSILTVPTGETVAAGNLIAMDDAGLSMSVAPVAAAVLQAVSTTSLCACPLSNGNTAVVWTQAGTQIRLMIISKTGAVVVGATVIDNGLANSPVWCAQLSNGNIVICYIGGDNRPIFKIFDQTITQIVGGTYMQASGTIVAGSQIKCCALTGGGFAAVYSISGSSSVFVIFSNTGTVVKSATGIGTSGQTRAAICSTAAGGFIVLCGASTLAGEIYDATGTLVVTCALGATSSSTDVNIASKSGYVAATSYRTDAGAYGPELSIASDASNGTVNSPAVTGNSGFVPPFSDLMPKLSGLGHGHVAVLGNGNFIATFAPKSGSVEYPRFVTFNERGLVADSGITSINTNGGATPVFVIPKDNNGFSLIWINGGAGNLMFAQVKSGKLLGISLGQVGAATQYKASGEVILGSHNMLNVGDRNVNFQRTGARVVI